MLNEHRGRGFLVRFLGSNGFPDLFGGLGALFWRFFFVDGLVSLPMPPRRPGAGLAGRCDSFFLSGLGFGSAVELSPSLLLYLQEAHDENQEGKQNS
ncbi:MAG: hypothetical protein CVU59_02230 [Deltaproteobacteria bacterium HGW-Deltaproteobacteria-17]|nr:MAG: hypothetical protein CVU59_02230 [Deltaproteobacteria bacterium HGW-Deltaproteobacteria-17]